MKKKDKTLIPFGDYCYTIKNGKQINCPYWSLREDKPEQANGYCSFLEKGDWELNPINNKQIKIIRSADPEKIGKSVTEVLGEDWPTSLLFDQIKECGENKWN